VSGDVPGWALLAMWGATLAGAYYLTRDVYRRFGRAGR
jgi:hypothetical protein